MSPARRQYLLAYQNSPWQESPDPARYWDHQVAERAAQMGLKQPTLSSHYFACAVQ